MGDNGCGQQKAPAVVLLRTGAGAEYNVADAQALNYLAVTGNIFLGEVCEKPAPAANHHEKATAGMVVLLVSGKMASKLVDACCE